MGRNPISRPCFFFSTPSVPPLFSLSLSLSVVAPPSSPLRLLSHQPPASASSHQNTHKTFEIQKKQLFARRVAVGVAASLEFATRVQLSSSSSSPATALPASASAALAAAYEAAYDAAAAEAERARAAPREWAVRFAHDCAHLGCREPLCLLCQHNPRRICPGALAPKGLAGDALRAACGAGARVELVRVGGEGDSNSNPQTQIHPRAREILIELTVLDGKAYQSLLDTGRGGDEAAALGCALLLNNQGGPLLTVHGTKNNNSVSVSSSSPSASASSSSSPAVTAAVAASLARPDGRVLLGLAAGGGPASSTSTSSSSSFANLTDVSVTGSSESLLSGQRPPFRLLARALDASTKLPLRGVALAVSDAFVVATPRVRTAVKAEIPMASDHVSKLNAVGPQTQAKLADVAAAWRAASSVAAAAAAGGSGSGVGNGGAAAPSSTTTATPGSSAALLADPKLPRSIREHASVTTVGQFRDLAEAVAADPELTDALKRVLKLTKGWEAACEHAAQAVEDDSRARVFYVNSSGEEGNPSSSAAAAAGEGLVFPGVLGAVDLGAPIGLLRPLEEGGSKGGSSSGSSGSRLTAIPRLGAADAARAKSMRAAAAAAWHAPGHPGWTLWEGSASQDVAARAMRRDVVIGSGHTPSSVAAAVAPPPPPPPPPATLPSRLPTMSWGLLAGTGGAPQFAAPADAVPAALHGKAVPASPFGAAAALAPAAATKRPLPPTSGFAAAANAAAKATKPFNTLASVPSGAAANANATATVDAAALQARLSQLVGRRLSGLDMARLIPTFPSVPLNADIFSSTALEALEFSRSELARIEAWEQQQREQQQQQGGNKAKKVKTNEPNAPLAQDRARDESLLRFLSERLQAAPGSGAAGAGLEGRTSGLEGMFLPTGVVIGGGAASAGGNGDDGGNGTGGSNGNERGRGGGDSNRQLHAPGFSTLPTLAPLVTATPSLFPPAAEEGGEAGATGGVAGGRRRSSRRQQKR